MVQENTVAFLQLAVSELAFEFKQGTIEKKSNFYQIDEKQPLGVMYAVNRVVV